MDKLSEIDGSITATSVVSRRNYGIVAVEGDPMADINVILNNVK